MIALPGGMPGAEHLRDCKKLEAMLKDWNTNGGEWCRETGQGGWEGLGEELGVAR